MILLYRAESIVVKISLRMAINPNSDGWIHQQIQDNYLSDSISIVPIH